VRVGTSVSTEGGGQSVIETLSAYTLVLISIAEIIATDKSLKSFIVLLPFVL
jgi:hypothetical protein